MYQTMKQGKKRGGSLKILTCFKLEHVILKSLIGHFFAKWEPPTSYSMLQYMDVYGVHPFHGGVSHWHVSNNHDTNACWVC